MANEHISNMPSEHGVHVALPKQSNLQIFATSNFLYNNEKKDVEYEQRIKNHINVLNRDRESLEPLIQQRISSQSPITHDGQRIYQLFHSVSNQRGQQSVDLFFQLFNNSEYYAFDLETFGDAQGREKAFGLAEISLNKYDMSGNLVEGAKNLNVIIRPEKDLKQQIQDNIEKIKRNKYAFNTLTDYEQRTLVDLMRYSDITEDGLDKFGSINGVLTHNQVVEKQLTYNDKIDYNKVVQYMDDYLKHMESGFQTVQRSDITMEASTAVKKFAQIAKNNSDLQFVTFNGNSFDVPVLHGVADQLNVDVPKDMKHLDLMNLIKTVYTDTDELKLKLNESYNPISGLGKNKLASFREALSMASKGAHNSTVDTNDTANLFSQAFPHIKEKIENSKTDIQSGFNYFPTEFTWSDTPLRHGQVLFSNGGVQARSEGEESFRASMDANGNLIPETNQVNKTVIHSKSFYRVDDIIDLTNGGKEKKLGLRLLDETTNEYSYVVRSGDNAMAELQSFVQSRFYNWDNVSPKMKKDIRHAQLTDRARRRYDRFFSMDGAGKGVNFDADGKVIETGTQGFVGAKRMFRNAQIMQQRLEGKHKTFDQRVEALMEEEGISRSAARNRLKRMDHDELLRSLDFNSLWDPTQKKFVENKAEKEQFFKMHQRLISELPAYQEAINIIDKEFSEELNQATKESNKAVRRDKTARVNQKRDNALMLFHEEVKRQVGVPEEEVTLKEYENRRVSYYDAEIDDTRSINFNSVEDARSNLYSYIKKGVGDGDNRQFLLQERTDKLIKILRSQNIINDQQFEEFTNLNLRSGSAWDTAAMMAKQMSDAPNTRFDRKRMQVSMGENKNLQNSKITDANKTLARNAVRDTKNAMFHMNVDNPTGKQLDFSQDLLKHLNIFDQSQLSHLTPNNYTALEHVIADIKKRDGRKQITLASDPTANDGNVKLYVHDAADSVNVRNQLNRRTKPTNALEINMPLINKDGTHRVGGLVLNAHSIATFEDGKAQLRSTSEIIARGYTSKMYAMLEALNAGDYELANKISQRTLREEIQSFSGIQRNMEFSENDTYRYGNNQSDTLKQDHVKVANAMIEQWYSDGELKETDFYEDVFYTDKKTGKTKLRRGVNFDDVKMMKTYTMLQEMPQWAKDHLGLDLYTSSVKADHVSKGTMSFQDMREVIPYGHYFNHGRDNAVQYFNAYSINQAMMDNIQKKDLGVTFDPLLRTPYQVNYEKQNPMKKGMNIKTGYMTQAQWTDAIETLYEQSEKDKNKRNILQKAGLLQADNTLNRLAVPRLYEQQGIVAKELVDEMFVKDHKRFEKGKQFSWHEETFQKAKAGKEITPGTLLGTRIHENGAREKVFYEGKKNAVIVEGLQEGQDIITEWKSQPFKLMLDGEKLTDTVATRELLKEITGRDDILALINPDVVKHKDFGMVMSGEARLLTDHVRSLQQSKNKKKRKQTGRAIKTIEEAGLGLTWDAKNKIFLDHSATSGVGGEAMDISATRFQEVLNQLKISNTTELNTGEKIRFGILEAHMSKVSNYSKTTDGSGRQVLALSDEVDREGRQHRIYAQGRNGVNWSHRELGVLKSRNMDATYNYVYKQIMGQIEGTDRASHHGHRGGKEINRLQEANNILSSFDEINQNAHQSHPALTVNDFRPLPELNRSHNTYKGTIFDREFIHSKGMGNEHGYWLELPGMDRLDGAGKDHVSVNIDGTKKELNKIFIPFTNQEGANGDIHLRDLQKHIGNIYERAKEMQNATSEEDARQAFRGLQGAVSRYVDQGFKDLTSSKGLLGEGAFKAQMPRSSSGLFKLMDPELSEKFGDGEFTVISEDMAKKMGIHDQLKDAQNAQAEVDKLRKQGKTVSSELLERANKDLYTANVRYPTFHQGAMQFTKLRMDKSVRDGEIHTTSFMSMAQNADSDGDYSHIVVIDDEKVQEEWKNAHDARQEEFKTHWKKHEKEKQKLRETENVSMSAYDQANGKTVNGVFQREVNSMDDLSQWEKPYYREVGKTESGKTIIRADNIPHSPVRTADEMAAKIGKMTIGRASNLNLYIRQIAMDQFEHRPDIQEKFFEFGRGLEQKLIDAKHGAKPAGLQMIDAIYSGNWNEAMRIDEQDFGKMFTEDFHMNTVAKELPTALTNLENGLHAQGLKFGTSTGVDSSIGIKRLVEMMHGGNLTDEQVKSNAFLNLFLKANDRTLQPRQAENPLPNIEPIQTRPQKIRQQAEGLMDKTKEIANDMTGNTIGQTKERIANLMESVKGKKGLMIGGALALGGLAGYNILNTDKPEMPYNNQRQSQPALSYDQSSPSTQNANIEVSASGERINQDQLSHAVNQGMRDTRMNAGPTRMTISQQDNTSQLNRQWYRDKVRENI